jgi:hypothetical protein
MELRIFEGTWEEVAQHTAELAGHRVRLTVLDRVGSRSMLDATLADLIKEAEQLATSRPPESIPLDAWGGAVAEKFRRQGFAL